MAIQVETASTGAVKEQPQAKTPVTNQQHVERQAAWATTSAEGCGLQEPARAPKATSTAWSAAAEPPCPDTPPRAVGLEPIANLLSAKSAAPLSSPGALSSIGQGNAQPATAKTRLTQQIALAHDPLRGATKPAAVSAARPPDRWLGRSWPDKAILAAKAEVATPEPGDRGCCTLEPEVLALLQALPAPNRGQLPPRKWGQPESRDEVYRLLAAAAKAAAAAEYELALRGYLRAFEVTRAPPLLLSVASMHLRLGQGHARPATAKARLLTTTLTQALTLTPTLTLTSHRQDPLDRRQLATLFVMCPGAPHGRSTAGTVGRRHARA